MRLLRCFYLFIYFLFSTLICGFKGVLSVYLFILFYCIAARYLKYLGWLPGHCDDQDLILYFKSSSIGKFKSGF